MKMIGITEAGDAGHDFSWVEALKSNKVEMAIVISKSLNERLIEELNRFPDRIIFHHTVTGYGGTILEPNVPPVTESLKMFRRLAETKYITDSVGGFNKVVLRVDPIIPTQKGIQQARDVLNLYSDTGICRVRFSIIDMYFHVKKRFLKAGLILPFQGRFTDNPNMIRSFMHDYLADYYAPDGPCSCINTCGEDSPVAQGCISLYDISVLEKDIPYIPRESRIRPFCLCPANKLEILSGKMKGSCPNQCLYCYWKRQGEL